MRITMIITMTIKSTRMMIMMTMIIMIMVMRTRMVTLKRMMLMINKQMGGPYDIFDCLLLTDPGWPGLFYKHLRH